MTAGCIVARTRDETRSNLAHLECHAISDSGTLGLLSGTISTSLGPIRGYLVS